MKIFWKYSRPLLYVVNEYKANKMLIFIMLLSIVLESIFSIVLPILAKLEMDQLAEKNEQLFGFIEASSFNIFIIILVIIFVGQFINMMISGIIDLIRQNYLEKFKNNFHENLLARMKEMEIWLLLNASNQRFFRDIIDSSVSLPGYLERFIVEIIQEIIHIVGIAVVFVMIDWRIFVLLFVSVMIWWFLHRFTYNIHEQERILFKYKSGYEIDMIGRQFEEHLPELMSSGGFNTHLTHFKNVNAHRIFLSRKYQWKLFGFRIINFIIDNIADIGIKMIVGFSVFAGTTSIGTMTMTLMYASKVESFLRFIRSFPEDLSRHLDNLAEFDIFLDVTEKNDNEKILQKKFQKIILKNVSFSYPNFSQLEAKFLQITEQRMQKNGYKWDFEVFSEIKQKMQEIPPVILKGIDMEFETGKTYGIVGKNGAGKTTIVSLLQKFFENYSGEIIFDNTESRKFSREFFEKNISMIHQEPYIVWRATIRENLLLGVEKKYSDEEIFAVLKLFGIDKKIMKHSEGLEATIGEDIDFSGGEKQLIVLARIILQDKKILIMDEWTNQLDAENEMLVMNELLKYKKDKIVIFITHRMTTIRKVDKIYTLKDGKIEASGTHDELIGRDNMYNFFWKTQVEV